MFWSESRVMELVERIERGESRASIARLWGVTRNTIVGKAYRLNLPDLRTEAQRSNARMRWINALIRSSDHLIKQADDLILRRGIQHRLKGRNPLMQCNHPGCFETRLKPYLECREHRPVPKRRGARHSDASRRVHRYPL